MSIEKYIEAISRDGYCIVPQVLSRSEVRELLPLVKWWHEIGEAVLGLCSLPYEHETMGIDIRGGYERLVEKEETSSPHRQAVTKRKGSA